MADNIYFLPNACGPLLREYYGKLLQEPIPQPLLDLLSMLEEASAAGHGGPSSDWDVREPAGSHAPEPGKPK
jgi:hypothetical protein